jgi:hypothetical protein
MSMFWCMKETFGPAEVCAAAGVPRATFHSWLSRKYISDAPGPGMGRERRFTLIEAIRIAVIAELNRFGVPVGTAAGYCRRISGDYSTEPTVMILGREQTMAAMDIVPIKQLGEIGKLIGQVPFLLVIDLTRIAANTQKALAAGRRPAHHPARVDIAGVGEMFAKSEVIAAPAGADRPPARRKREKV